MGYIFISYSHKDKDYAHKLHDKLQNEGFEVWIDDRIDYGTEWPKVVQEQLDGCDVFIVVVTENSFKSKWVQNEVARADRKGKAFLPLLRSGDPWLSIETTQYVDVRDGELPPDLFYGLLEKYTERDEIIDSSLKHITDEWNVYQNDKYHFLIKYPLDAKPTIDTDHIRIEFPVIAGTNLQQKTLSVTTFQGEKLSELHVGGLPVKKRKVRVGNITFLQEIGDEGFAGHHAQVVRYTTSRENIHVSITLEMIFVSKWPFYPNLLPQMDVTAEQEAIKLVASSFNWLM